MAEPAEPVADEPGVDTLKTVPLPPPPRTPSSPSGDGAGQRPLPAPPAPPTTSTPNSGGSERCYRHGDRLAGRRCTRCGRPACGECLVTASVGSHCVDCARAAKPSATERAKLWSAGQPALVTTVLIGVNVAVFVLAALASGDIAGFLAGRLTEIHIDLGLSRRILEIPFESSQVALTGDSRWLRLVTSGFMHFGILHLLMNMYFLYVLGPQLERPLGRGKYLLLYFASLLGGSAGVMIMGGTGITAGASGAVFGLLGATAVGLWRQGVNPFSTGIGMILLINLFLTFSISGISVGGHLGGLVAGAICGYVMLAPGYKPISNGLRWATPVLVGLAAVTISVAVAI